MSDINPLEDLIPLLDETDDPELQRIRDRIRAGEEQPAVEPIEVVDVMVEQFSLEAGDSIVLVADASIEELAKLATENDASVFAAVVERSVTAGDVILFIEAGTEASLPADPLAEEAGLAPIAFFEHHHGEDDNPTSHDVGMVVKTDSVLGHWLTDVTGEVVASADSDGESPAALRFTLVADEDDGGAEVPLTLGSVAFVVAAFGREGG